MEEPGPPPVGSLVAGVRRVEGREGRGGAEGRHTDALQQGRVEARPVTWVSRYSRVSPMSRMDFTPADTTATGVLAKDDRHKMEPPAQLCEVSADVQGVLAAPVDAAHPARDEHLDARQVGHLGVRWARCRDPPAWCPTPWCLHAACWRGHRGSPSC